MFKSNQLFNTEDVKDICNLGKFISKSMLLKALSNQAASPRRVKLMESPQDRKEKSEESTVLFENFTTIFIVVN